ncbi:MAG: lactate utilization protein [Oxalobacteraceae bacterium]|nr:lactate utilization protein [Oxalobacteraceae bacterium]
MQVQSMHFKARAGQKLADVRLQQNLKKLSTKFVTARSAALTELDDFEATRDQAVERRMRAIHNLDVWLDTFEREATRRGATVLYAETAQDAARLVVEIAQKHGVKKAIKSKSMVSEEMQLNRALEAVGVVPIETDLGEYILQINDNEAPSHIIAPVVHKDKDEIADLFAKVHQKPRLTDIPQMTREAREMLRPQFLSADMVTGIEKVLPTLNDLATIMRLLPRSATGQSISNYFSLLTGPRGAQDHDGPEHMYFVLVDAGRSRLIGSEFEDMLRCIRCGACMNHCPVYQKIGGHSYGWVYPGPMGSVLTPSYVGIENAVDLPQASTLCGECHVVCPVKIPLPDLLRKLREKQFKTGLRQTFEYVAFGVWAFFAQRPTLYRFATKWAARVMKLMGGQQRLIHALPGAAGWTDQRDMPAPSGKTFREIYRERQRS